MSKSETVSTKEFDQESQLPFVSVEKEPTTGGDGGLIQKMKERPFLFGLIGTLVLVVLLGTILGVTLSGGGGSGGGGPLGDEVADSRLVTVVREGEECPADVGAATHVVLPPVSVRTSTGECSADCTLTYDKSPCAVSAWRQSGRKVLLSFGSVGWDGCWAQCYDKGAHVAQQLASLRTVNDLDGVAFVFDHSPSGAEMAEAESFYTTTTQELRTVFPENALIAHIGYDIDLVKGTWYSRTMDTVGDSIDFLVAQYFNGVTRPGLEGLAGGVHVSALDHYRRLVEGSFKGDSTKLVFGFCISSCSATKSNVDAQTAAALVKELQATYPCNGGVSYWAGDDASGSWGISLKDVVTLAVRCSVEGVPGSNGTTSTPVGVARTEAPTTEVPTTNTPTVRATSTPTQAPPTTSAPPTPFPTAAPPTPKPTPAPTNAIPGCGQVVGIYKHCTTSPDCCTEGTRCYQQAPFKATCLAICNYPPRCKLIGS